MNKGFKDSIPVELVTHVTAGCGRAGEQWLEMLPDIVGRLEDLWSLRVRDPFPAIEFNYVAPALMYDSQDVVVKIAPPWDTVEIHGEAAWLGSRQGNYAVELLAEDRESRAILIERELPGESLTECFKGREPESVRPAIEVMTAILRPAPVAGTDLVSLDDWFK